MLLIQDSWHKEQARTFVNFTNTFPGSFIMYQLR